MGDSGRAAEKNLGHHSRVSCAALARLPSHADSAPMSVGQSQQIHSALEDFTFHVHRTHIGFDAQELERVLLRLSWQTRQSWDRKQRIETSPICSQL